MIFYVSRWNEHRSTSDHRFLNLLQMYDITRHNGSLDIRDANEMQDYKHDHPACLLISVIKELKANASFDNFLSWVLEDNVEILFLKANILGIPIYIDWSWEYFPFYKLIPESHPEFIPIRDLLLHYGVKILCNTIRGDQKRFNIDIEIENEAVPLYEVAEKITHNFNLFEFHTRICNLHYNDNIMYDLNVHPTEEKKYEFSYLSGEIKKMKNHRLILELHRQGLIDKCFTAMIWTEYQPANWETELKESAKIFKDVIGDKDIFDFIYHKPFDGKPCKPYSEEWEKRYIPATHEERRLPKEVHESYFNIACETTESTYFYTEKTFKFIAHTDDPWIIYTGGISAPKSIQANMKFKKEFGYEIFEEIFDYSFEKELAEDLYRSKFVKELVRVSKEPKSIFTQPSVLEKLRYNKRLFLKKNSAKQLIKEIQGLFN